MSFSGYHIRDTAVSVLLSFQPLAIRVLFCFVCNVNVIVKIWRVGRRTRVLQLKRKVGRKHCIEFGVLLATKNLPTNSPYFDSMLKLSDYRMIFLGGFL